MRRGWAYFEEEEEEEDELRSHGAARAAPLPELPEPLMTSHASRFGTTDGSASKSVSTRQSV